MFDKSEALNTFKVYEVKVEKQKKKRIKIVRSKRGGEYYGRYTGEGQMLSLFTKILKQECIIA